MLTFIWVNFEKYIIIDRPECHINGAISVKVCEQLSRINLNMHPPVWLFFCPASCAAVKNLGIFFHSTLVRLTQLGESVSCYRQWCILQQATFAQSVKVVGCVLQRSRCCSIEQVPRGNVYSIYSSPEVRIFQYIRTDLFILKLQLILHYKLVF